MSDRDPDPDEAPARAAGAAAGKTNLVVLHDARARAEELLAQRFSEDVIDDDELERRLELVQAATGLDEIASAIEDLRPPEPAEGSAALVPAGAGSLVRIDPGEVPVESRSVCVFGDTRLDGGWTPAREIRTITVFGDTHLDFREARMAPGVITLKVHVVFGDVVIVVPPGLPVDVACSTFFADKKTQRSAPAPADPDGPRVRVEGVAVFSDVIVDERLPGETRRQARKRRKREAKARELETAERKRLGDGRSR